MTTLSLSLMGSFLTTLNVITGLDAIQSTSKHHLYYYFSKLVLIQTLLLLIGFFPSNMLDNDGFLMYMLENMENNQKVANDDGYLSKWINQMKDLNHPSNISSAIHSICALVYAGSMLYCQIKIEFLLSNHFISSPCCDISSVFNLHYFNIFIFLLMQASYYFHKIYKYFFTSDGECYDNLYKQYPILNYISVIGEIFFFILNISISFSQTLRINKNLILI